jgi:hypothetical protein
MIVLWLLYFAAGSCLSVSGERIVAKDLARAVPEFAALPDTLSLGFSPMPGAHRGFTGADIQRIASQYGIKTSFHEAVCFEWPMRRLERQDVLKAMEDSLGRGSVQVEEYSLFPAPAGQVVFPLNGLNRQPQGVSFWRGYVEYAPDKRFNIWAKARVDASVAPEKRAEVVGGTQVTVLVRSGAAELKFEAQAISSGIKGQMVNVRNPRSGKSFVAEVAGRNSVVVEAGK